MWHHICQGLMLLGLVGRLADNLYVAAKGRKEREPTGGVGIVVSVIYCALAALVVWKSGALDTIVGSP